MTGWEKVLARTESIDREVDEYAEHTRPEDYPRA